MAGLRVARIENLSTGGSKYRLYLDGEEPFRATLFASFANGAGLFMLDHPLDRLKFGDSGPWFIVAADGEVIPSAMPPAFTLRRIAE